MHARTKAHIHEGYTGEPDDDETAWLLLRARAELLLQTQQPTKLPPPLPRRHPTHARANGLAVPTMPFHEHEVGTLHLLDDDEALRSLSSRGRGLPVVLLASLVAGLLTAALAKHFVTEAEQQAQIEEVISHIRSASAQLPAPTQDELQRVPPLAEAPTSETLRAFQKLSVSTVPLSSTASMRASLSVLQPSRANVERKPQPAARAAVKTTPLLRATAVPQRAERQIEPDLSDDPLRDL